MGFLDRFSRKPDIGSLKENRDINGLIKALKYKKNFKYKKNHRNMSDIMHNTAFHDFLDIRRKAAEALGEIGDERAIKPLQDAIKNDNNFFSIRETALDALEKIESRAKNRGV